MTARSYLFVPADRPERFAKALAAGADAVIIDLEDAVAPAAKPAARDALANWLAGPGARSQSIMVRINAADTDWFADDLALCAHPSISSIMLPKAAVLDEIKQLLASAGATAVVPLVETAAGMADARALAAQAGVSRLAFGTVDFQLDLGIDGDGDELLAFRSELVLASRLASIAAPIDGVETRLDEAAVLAAASDRARRLGFGAKLCIHPRQVAVVNTAFAPSAQALDWARRVLAAAQASGGAAVALDGKMVDAPVIARARQLLDGAPDAD